MSIAFGILLGLCGSIAINTGNNLQSYGMHFLELNGSEDLGLCDSWYWIVGTVIFLGGACLNFASFGFAPQSTLASLGSIQFVCNILFGKLLLEKVITWKMLFGSLLAVGGTVLAVCFASREAAEIRDVQDLVSLWNNLYWIAYTVILVVVAALIHFAYNLLDLRDSKYNLEIVMATMYAVLSALFGTLSVVFAKTLAKLLELQTQNINTLTEWYSYVTAVSWLVLMAFWLYRLNSALGLYNPLLIIPLLQSSFILFSNISGGLYFQEFNYMEPMMWVGFCSGVVIMFIGIFLLVPSNEEADSDREFDESNIRESNLGHRKDMANFFMTGAGRMHQYQWDLRLQKIMNERRLTDLGGKKSLTAIEAALVKQLHLSIMEADTWIKSEDELAECFSSGGQVESYKIKDLMIKCVESERALKKGNVIVKKCEENVRREEIRNSRFLEAKNKMGGLIPLPENDNRTVQVGQGQVVLSLESESSSSVCNPDFAEGTEESVFVVRSVDL